MTRVQFADLPEHLRSEIALEWGVHEREAAAYFDTRTAAGRWEIIGAFTQTSPLSALRSYLAAADAITLRDLGHLLLARSRQLEAAA